MEVTFFDTGEPKLVFCWTGFNRKTETPEKWEPFVLAVSRYLAGIPARQAECQTEIVHENGLHSVLNLQIVSVHFLIFFNGTHLLRYRVTDSRSEQRIFSILFRLIRPDPPPPPLSLSLCFLSLLSPFLYSTHLPRLSLSLFQSLFSTSVFVCPSVCLYVCLCLSVSITVVVCLFLSVSVRHSVCLSFSPSSRLSLSLSPCNTCKWVKHVKCTCIVGTCESNRLMVFNFSTVSLNPVLF